MKIIYQSEDGRLHETREECTAWENRIKKCWIGFDDGGFSFYDEDGNELVITNSNYEDNVAMVVNAAYYVVMWRDLTEKETRWVRNEIDPAFPCKRGIWRYELIDDSWYDYETEYQKFSANWPTAITKFLHNKQEL